MEDRPSVSKGQQSPKMHVRLKRLRLDGMIVRIDRPDRIYLPENKGLALLAHLSGVKPEAANRHLGFTVRDCRFQTQIEHHRITVEFILRLFAEKSLAAWDFTASRFVFADIHAPFRPEIRRLVILPDSDGLLYSTYQMPSNTSRLLTHSCPDLMPLAGFGMCFFRMRHSFAGIQW